jgi:hypothetical protein
MDTQTATAHNSLIPISSSIIYVTGTYSLTFETMYSKNIFFFLISDQARETANSKRSSNRCSENYTMPNSWTCWTAYSKSWANNRGWIYRYKLTKERQLLFFRNFFCKSYEMQKNQCFGSGSATSSPIGSDPHSVGCVNPGFKVRIIR